MIARLQVETAGQRHRRADLELAAEVTDGLPLDTAAADEAIRSDPDEPPALVAAHLAYHAALKVVAAGGDGTAPLAAVRPSLGRLPSEVILRLWFSRLYYAVVSALIGAWLLACVVVGLGTAGGVVWF